MLLPHARYLVARQGLHRRAAFWPLVALPLAFTFVWPHATTAFVAVLGAALLARGATLRRAPKQSAHPDCTPSARS